MKTLFRFLLFGLVLALGVQAGPAIYPGNGHAYEIVNGNYFWDAHENAPGHLLNGVPAHLAIIDSQALQDFLLTNMERVDELGTGGAWFGLFRQSPIGTPNVNGDWAWNNGQALSFTFTPWASGEPDGWAAYLLPDGTWGSSEGSYFRLAIVEYDSIEPPAETPEAATMLMIASGLFLLRALAQRRTALPLWRL